MKPLPHPTAAISSWSEIPWNAYALVAIGFFLGPIYPTIISALLMTKPKSYHAVTMSLVMIFTALFDSVSSKIMDVMIYFTSDQVAFSATVLPCLIILFLFIVVYYRLAHKYRFIEKEI